MCFFVSLLFSAGEGDENRKSNSLEKPLIDDDASNAV